MYQRIGVGAEPDMGLPILILSLGRQKHKDGQALHSDSQASLGCSCGWGGGTVAAHQGFLTTRNMSVKVLLFFPVLGVRELEKWDPLFLPVLLLNPSSQCTEVFFFLCLDDKSSRTKEQDSLSGIRMIRPLTL